MAYPKSWLPLVFLAFLMPSCALFGMLWEPDLTQEKKDRFLQATGHELLHIYVKEDKLGYIVENGVFIKQVWGGNKVVTHSSQSIKLTYTREDIDKISVFLGENLDLGPKLENVHHIEVYLEDIEQHQLVDIQPLIEHMGKESSDLLQEDFVASMLKVTRFSVQAFQKTQGEFGVEYRPSDLPLKVRGSTGTSSGRTEDQVGYNIFIGYRLFNGSRWIQDFEQKPSVDIWILRPENNAVIDQVRTRIHGSVVNFTRLNDETKNQLRVYLMSRDENDDFWLLQSKVTIDNMGRFEGIVKLGTLEEGDGHRYSLAAFATYFEINREANSRIPFLPFNKGKYVINVDRRDRIE